MWLFTKYGFYSVTQSSQDPAVMQIRARAKEDLERLQAFARHKTPVSLGKISETLDSDYRYRIFCSKPTWQQVANALAADINYSNFKNQIRDDFRHRLYSRVWGIMLELQKSWQRPLEVPQLGIFDTLTRTERFNADYTAEPVEPSEPDPGDPFYDPGRITGSEIDLGADDLDGLDF